MISCKRQQGFSLLEVLVAFAILSMTLGIILQILSLSATTTYRADLQQQAMLLAENKMAEILTEPVLEQGHEQSKRYSSARGLLWETEISEFRFPDESDTFSDSTLIPYKISVIVSQEESGQPLFRLTTIRLVRDL